MGRYKSRKDGALPAYVTRVKSKDRVTWREYLGQGKVGRVVTLCNLEGKPLPAAASQKEILSAYNRQVTKTTTHTLRWLVDAYFEGDHFKRRAKSTQKAYRLYADAICGHAVRNGRVLGAAPLRALTPPIFSKYRDSRSATAPVSANRELQFIRAVFSWGIEYGKCASNPAKGVRLNPAKSRDRYVEDWELALLHKHAAPALRVAIELAYLLRARASEVLSITTEDIKADGILLRRLKGSDSELTLWSPRLEKAVSDAQAMPSRKPPITLLHDKGGDRVKYAALRSAFVRAMDKAQADGLKDKFTFHDLKAKGITDHKTHHGGHRSARMADVYIRKPDEVESTR